MLVSEAVTRRISVRAFRSDPVAESVVREILDAARRAPSGGNLQPWRVDVIAGSVLTEFKKLIAGKMADPAADEHEYDVYPPKLWDPFRRRRFECGEDMYGTLGIKREDRAARLRWFARNYEFFGAPVGLFFSLDRKVGPPQWSDVGMYMQTVMLLAMEKGLDTCPQEAWSRFAKTVADFIALPPDYMLFSGMALGYRDTSAPVNTLRTARDPLDSFATFRGFEG